VAYFISETYGVTMTSSSESGMMIALIPIAVAFISRWVLKEKLTPRQWGAVLLSVTGVMMIVGAKGFSQTSGSIGGYLLLLLAVISAALYSSISRKLRTQNTPYEITFVMMWAGAIVFNTIGLISAASSGTMGTYFSDAFQAETIFGVLYLGVLSSVVAFFCINYALSKVKASVSSGFANLTTVISVVAGVVIGGETILPLQIAGIVVILAALWWLATSKNNGRIRNNMQ